MSIDEMTLREEIARAIEAIPLGEENAQLNALGMRMLADTKKNVIIAIKLENIHNLLEKIQTSICLWYVKSI
jgi:hypothetical protein